MTFFLGIDIGSSSIKGGVLDRDRGTVEHVRQRPFPSPAAGLPATFFEVDPLAIVQETRAVLEELAAQCKAAQCKEVSGVVFSCQMGGVILTDSAFQPVTRYLSWRDQRVTEKSATTGRTAFEDLRNRCTADDLLSTGNELRPGSAVSLMYWLAQHRSIPATAVTAMNLGEFVISQLCGSTPRTEPTMALGSLNLRTRQVHRDWFERLGFGQITWPAITSVSECAGEVVLGARRIPCYPAVGDHQCALLGAGLEEGELSLNISTGSQVSMLTQSLVPGDYQTRPFFDNRFLNTITHLPAGRSLNALVDLLSELSIAEGRPLQDPWTSIVSAVDRTPSTDLKADLSFFAGSMGDHGSIGNIRLENLSVGHLFIAAFSCMADNYELCAGRLSPDRAWKQVVLSGGLPQKLPRLNQILAARFPGPIRSPKVIEEALEGLLRLTRSIER